MLLNENCGFAQLGKNATLPKSKKRDAPKKPVRSESSTVSVSSHECEQKEKLINGQVGDPEIDPPAEAVYNLVQEVIRCI